MQHSRERLEEAIGWICTVMCGVFTHTVWWDDVRPLTDDRDFPHNFKVWMGGTMEAMNNCTIQLGVTEVTLLNIRRLAEFFDPGKTRHKNIIRASSYPGFETQSIMAKRWLGILDDRIAHMTWTTVDDPVDFRMPAWQNTAGQRSMEFLDYLNNEFKPDTDEMQQFVRSTRRFLAHYLERIKELDKEHRWPPSKNRG